MDAAASAAQSPVPAIAPLTPGAKPAGKPQGKPHGRLHGLFVWLPGLLALIALAFVLLQFGENPHSRCT
jgi:hypothetical protein